MLTVLNNHPAIAILAAQEISEAIKNKAERGESFVLGLATGSTMEPVYAELIRMHQEELLDFSHVIFFNLDNYVGLDPDDRNNYDKQLHDLFLTKINADSAKIFLVSSAFDFDHDAYEALIKSKGGVDIQLLGIGRTGHIGFNEVGSSACSLTRETELSQETRDDNGKFFNQINKITHQTETIPLTAHTRGIGPILEAKKIICLANGHGKAQAVQELFEPGTVEELPARALHLHPNTMICVDLDALALFNHGGLTAYTDLDADQIKTVIKTNQSHTITLQIRGGAHDILLPPQFDFYNPKTMDINDAFDFTNQAHLTDLAACLEAAVRISVGAHPDDAEIMAGPMMLEASSPWLTLIVTNGAATNNTLNGEYSKYTPEELTSMRQQEQREASRFAGVPLIMCKFPTPAITGDMGVGVLQRARVTLGELFGAMQSLEMVYGHNPFDEHDTHVNVFAEQVEALRGLSDERLSRIKIRGMDVWGIQHVAKTRQLKIPVEHEHEHVLTEWYKMINFYKSQIASQGRDYSETTINRARGNAGYHTHPHGANPAPGLILATDLTDLVHRKSLSISNMVRELISDLNEQEIHQKDMILRDRNAGKRKREATGVITHGVFACSKDIDDGGAYEGTKKVALENL
ncbi:MAG: 6-phosphogluconolactonase [Legionellaceae bacterium]|nr:6-phosphogluconolactonase [Legionellaceae bacterium]